MTHPPWLRLRVEGVELSLRISPSSTREGAAGLYGDRLRLRLRQVASGGLANQALIVFLSRASGIPRSRIRIVVGSRSRSKTVLLSADGPQARALRLGRSLGRPGGD